MSNLARQRRLTLLLGPSGSGKSSLIQAGVLRALAAGELPGSDRWLPVLARPRQDLLAEIERPQLAALAPRLLDKATPGLLNVPGTVNRQDLHDIIVLPAQDGGLHFQPGLPEQIIADILAAHPEEATAQQAPVTVLPLLELTLTQLWLRRHDGYLTQAYRRIGAVSGSLTPLVHPADRSRHTPPSAHKSLQDPNRPARWHPVPGHEVVAGAARPGRRHCGDSVGGPAV